MKFVAASLVIMLTPTLAAAQQAPSILEITTASIKNTIQADTAAGLSALNEGNFQEAALRLRTASIGANRLSLQSITQKISAITPSFEGLDSRFALSQSSTINFDRLLKDSNTAERRFKNDKGDIVTVRIFGEDDDLKDFVFIADDDAMRQKGSLELAEMRGEQAIKKAGADGSLSVIMMSEGDHALIEIEGKDSDTVMAFIGELEAGAK